jgi:cell surface protein SprA
LKKISFHTLRRFPKRLLGAVAITLGVAAALHTIGSAAWAEVEFLETVTEFCGIAFTSFSNPVELKKSAAPSSGGDKKRAASPSAPTGVNRGEFIPNATAPLYAYTSYYAAAAFFAPRRTVSDTDSVATGQMNFLQSDTTRRTLGLDSTARFDSTRFDSSAYSYTPLDSTVIDTTPKLSAADSLYLFPDSTARIEQFKYQRIDAPYIAPIEQRTYSLFLPRVNLKRDVTIDSLGETVTITEKLGETDVRTPITLSFEEYKKIRSRTVLAENFRSIIGATVAPLGNDAISQMLGKFTKVSIYVPGGESAIFATLFGPPTVSIQVTGNIDIRASYNNETSEDPGLVATGAANRGVPNFDQQVQLNLTGAIGDKLTITADWNTQRTFEFENQLKLTYKGYEDDVVQSIEAGNVALALPTQLIGSSQALFGIKARLQLAGLSLTTIFSQQRGRSETIAKTNGAENQSFNLDVTRFDNGKHFLISNFYGTRWDSAFPTDQVPVRVSAGPQGQQLTLLEVWLRPIAQNALLNQPNVQKGIAIFDYGDQPYRAAIAQNGQFRFPDQRLGDLDPTTTAAVLNQIRTVELDSGVAPILAQRGLAAFSKPQTPGNFIRLTENVDYVVNSELGFITMLRNLDIGDELGVSYLMSVPANPSAPLIKVGDFLNDQTPGTRKVFKLIKPIQMTNVDTAAWYLMLKNIYSLGGKRIREEQFSFNITYLTPGGGAGGESPTLPVTGTSTNDRQLLRILGLDNFSGTPANQPPPDNQFDFRPRRTINTEQGIIIFPYMRPFDTPIRRELTRLGVPDSTAQQFVFNELYDSDPNTIQISPKNKYVLKGKYRGEASDKIIIGVNVVQGSVRVSDRGRRLTEGTDYVVDYQLGEVSIRDPNALAAGSDLRVEFEKNDLVLLASRSIIGARAEYQFSDDFKIGSTFLQYSERPLADKLRVGDEPILNRIYGADIQYKTRMRWLTKLIDKLPLISTKEISEFQFNAEFAQVLPGIPQELRTPLDPDGVSYIDDFEGSRQVVTLGLNGPQWTLASAPNSRLVAIPREDSIRTAYRAELNWYRPPTGFTGIIPVRTIFPNRQAAREDNQVRPLYLRYNPTRRGAFNYSPYFVAQSQTQALDSSWGGIMRAFPSFAQDLRGQNQNIQFVEFWFRYENLVNAATLSDSGVVYLDLGSISTDIIPNGSLNTEDGMGVPFDDTTRGIGRDAYGRFLLRTSAITADNILNPNNNGFSEDVGIDGITDVDEQRVHAGFVSQVQNLLGAGNPIAQAIATDPSGDNFPTSINLQDLQGISGQQGNYPLGNPIASAFGNQLPDTEGLVNADRNNTANAFFRYVIPINPALLQSSAPRGKYVVGGGATNGGWVQFRIPIERPDTVVGNPSFRTITYARIWTEKFKQPAQLGFATLDFIGSQWLRLNNDSAINTASINIEENSSQYTLPPGILRARDRQRADQNILANEQALVLTASLGLTDSSRSRGVQRAFSQNNSQGLNLNPYQRLKMFVHGAQGVRETGDPNRPSNTQAFIRFGLTGTDNYYEYRVPVRPSQPNIVIPQDPNSPDYRRAQELLWPAENEIDIDLERISGFKLGQDSASIGRPIPLGDGKELVIRGQPSIGDVRFIVIGLRNTDPRQLVNKDTDILDTVTIWVNELRVSGYRQESGWAVRTNANLKLADVGTVSANYQRQTADFHRIDVRINPIAAQNETQSWTLSTTWNLQKLTPAEDGWTFPLSFERSETRTDPKYLPNQSDILVEVGIERFIQDTLQKLQAVGANNAQQIAQQYGELLRNRTVTLSSTARFGLPTIQKTKPSDFWLGRYTIDRMQFGFNYSTTRSRSPAIVFSEDYQWNFNAGYSIQLPQDKQPYIEPLSWLKDVPWVKIYSDMKFYFVPQTYGATFTLTRSRNQQQPRDAFGRDLPIAPAVNLFTNARGLTINYSITDAMKLSYSAALNSNLQLLVEQRDSLNGQLRQTEFETGDVVSRFFDQLSSFQLGRDATYSQNTGLDWQPALPTPLNWLKTTVGYTAAYSWANPVPVETNPLRILGNSVGTQSNFRTQATISFRDLGSKLRGLFGGGDANAPPTGGVNKYQGIHPSFISLLDTTGKGEKSGESNSLKKLFSDVGGILGVFTNFDQLSLNLTVGTTLNSSGIAGSPGFFNFFPFNQLRDKSGPAPPSIAYQLGFSDFPGDRIEFLSGAIPLQFSNSFAQNNSFSAATTWNISENIKVDLNWQTAWGINRTAQINSQTNDVTNVSTTGTVTRSFISIGRTVDNLREAFFAATPNLAQPSGEVFINTFETVFEPTGIGRLTGRVFGLSGNALSLIPLPNWRVSINGLEKLDLFANFAQTMSLDHSYTSTYSTSYTDVPNVARQTNSAIINEQFSPLLGVNLLWKFGMTSTVSFGRTRSFTAGNNFSVNESRSSQLTVSLGLQKRGLKIPLSFWPFNGATLDNDLDVNFNFSIADDERVQSVLAGTAAATNPPIGTTRLTYEPRISYALSSRVNAAFFWRYTSITPKATGGGNIFASSRQEIGFNFRVSIGN